MLKVLIAEDDLMIADMIEELLASHGYVVCGIARTVADAVSLTRRHKPDLAIIDLRLADKRLGTEIVAQLDALDRPGVLYATGNIAQVELTSADGQACLVKPFRTSELLRSLEIVTEIVATGRASPPLPRGLHILPAAGAKHQETMHG
ncbi:MAG TPA: response regulator [Aliidongia sp.]|nr:response regulator [Aliidongia sp.]